MDFQLTEEQQYFRRIVRDFTEAELKPRARHTDEAAEFNWPAVKKMGPIGLLGLNAPEEYGGAGVDAISAAIAIEEIGRGCGSTGLAIAAHNGLGCAPIALFGSEELKQKFLPPLASGSGQLAALALTEPGAGSDLSGGVQTFAKHEGDEWMIIGPAEKKMGLKGSPTHAVTYDNVRVPCTYLVGKEGYGLHHTLQVLDGGRVGIGALAIGLAQAAYEAAIAYAKERRTFGVPIAQHEAIQWMIADATTQIEAARLLVYKAAWLKANGQPFTKEAAMAKLFASEVSEKVCFNAIQIHGGYGYSSEYPVERIYRDQRLMTIGEGTSEIQRLVIARNALAQT